MIFIQYWIEHGISFPTLRTGRKTELRFESCDENKILHFSDFAELAKRILGRQIFCRIAINSVFIYFSKMVGFFRVPIHPIAFFDWNRARKHDGAIKRMIRGWVLHQSEPTNREILGFSLFSSLWSLFCEFCIDMLWTLCISTNLCIVNYFRIIIDVIFDLLFVVIDKTVSNRRS